MLRLISFISLCLLFVCLIWTKQSKVVSINQPDTTPVVYSLEDDDKSAAASAAYEKLGAEFDAAIAELRKKVKSAKSEQQKKELFAQENPAPIYAQKHLDLARKFPGTKAAVNAVLFAIGQSNGDLKVEAMDYLLDNYANKVRLDKIAESFKSEIPSQQIEDWYLKMIEKAEKDSIKVSVAYDYAKYAAQIATFKKTLEINPVHAARLPAPQREYILSGRSEAQDAKVENALQMILDNYASVKKGRSTYGELAQRELFDLQNLQVGDVAPEIVGKDLDGIEFKLSDYRGKVVMLDFWGHWCPPCRAMYGKEQEIVRKLADKPFVLLGVNSDAELETAQDAVRDESLSWRHFWNGPRGTRGPISNQWNVEGWPTVYLIDGDGIIRYKEVLGEGIEEGIEKLMAEAGHEVQISSSKNSD